MSNEYEADLITLIDDDDNEHEFEVIDEINIDEGKFLALLPTAANDLAEQDTYYIFETYEEDGEEQLVEVEDEALLDKLASLFEKRFEENFYNEEELETLEENEE